VEVSSIGNLSDMYLFGPVGSLGCDSALSAADRHDQNGRVVPIGADRVVCGWAVLEGFESFVLGQPASHWASAP